MHRFYRSNRKFKISNNIRYRIFETFLLIRPLAMEIYINLNYFFVFRIRIAGKCYKFNFLNYCDTSKLDWIRKSLIYFNNWYNRQCTKFYEIYTIYLPEEKSIEKKYLKLHVFVRVLMEKSLKDILADAFACFSHFHGSSHINC